MGDVSQVLNKVLGRIEVGDVRFWENAERAGWLMKQGNDINQCVVLFIPCNLVHGV